MNCQVTVYCQISSVGNCLLRTLRGHKRSGRWRGKCQLGMCTNQSWGAQARTLQQAVLAQWFVDITELFPDTTFFTIRKLVLRTNEIKRWRDINQYNSSIHTFDLRWTLPKYLRTFLHKNAVLMIGLTDQSDYSIFHLLVRIFIRTVCSKSSSNETPER